MSNTSITYLVGAGCGVIALVAFVTQVMIPGVSAYRGIWQRAAAAVLSLYVLGALVAVGVLAGAAIVVEWPRVF
ncbi:MAG: hypothetical protein ACLP8S_09110 [Solirubrobacteraceae bacterium]|jgi:hypothetical protein